MATVLEIKNMCKKFGGVAACNGLDFKVEEGEIMGVIGPNGAGKTTLFNIITGVYKPTNGNILFQGQEIGGQIPDRIVKKGVARTFQNIRLFQNLTVLDNVKIALDTKKTNYSIFEALVRTRRVRVEENKLVDMSMEFLRIVGLEDKANVRADCLPYGFQRKLEIARALASEPQLLLLDEPAAGMNPEESMELSQLIRKIKKDCKLTILLIEHHMDVVMNLCDHIVVMNFGEKLAEGKPEEIQNNPLVIKAYLGGGDKNAKN